MSEQIASDRVKNSEGEWHVSTIRTDAGGAPSTQRLGEPFSSADYIDETPWAFETMVFAPTGSKDNCHEPYATLKEAKAGHKRFMKAVKNETLEKGKGIKLPWGNPSMTPDEWFESQKNSTKKGSNVHKHST